MNNRKINRREFFRSAARGSVLAGLGAMALYLTRRDKKQNPAAGACFRFNRCRGCSALKNCGISVAEDYRRKTGRYLNNG